MSDDERQVEDELREEENYTPPQKKKKKSKRTKRMNQEGEEEAPKASREFMLLYKLFNKHAKSIDRKLNLLEEEVKTQKSIVTQAAGVASSSKESTPVPLGMELADKRIVYSITNLNQERPKFGGHGYKRGGKEVHPVSFLEDLTSYLKKIPAQGKELDIVQECLSDQARNWARIYKDRWRTLDDFKKDFLETFWSEVEQNRVRRDIVSNTWDQKECPTMLGHFLKLAGQINLLTFKIPEKQLVADIMRHYPKHVQQLWALSRNETILAATEFLRQMDNINMNEEPTKKETIEREIEGPSGSRQEHFKQKRHGKRLMEKYKNNIKWKKPESSSRRESGGAGVSKAPDTAATAALVEEIKDSGN